MIRGETVVVPCQTFGEAISALKQIRSSNSNNAGKSSAIRSIITHSLQTEENLIFTQCPNRGRVFT